MKTRIRILVPFAAAVLAFGLTACDTMGNSPREHTGESYAPNGNGSSPGGGVGTGRGNTGAGPSGGLAPSPGNGGGGSGGSGGGAAYPPSRP